MKDHTSTISAEGPSGPGALAGFKVSCACGFTFRVAFEATARRDAADHAAYMAAKEAKAR